MEDSLDGGPPSVGSGDIPAATVVVPGNTTTPVTTKKVRSTTIVFKFFNTLFLFLFIAKIQQEQSGHWLHFIFA